VTYRDQQGKRRARQFPTKKQATDFLTKAAYEVSQGIHSPASTSITVELRLPRRQERCRGLLPE
jgi:integrase